MKTIVWYDSALKRDFMYWLEFEPDVISYATSAISFDYYELGKLQHYVPDFQVIHRHKKQIIDVKSKKTLQSDRYRQLYQRLSRICDEKGWTLIDLGEGEVNGVKFNELGNTNDIYQAQSKFVSLNKIQEFLTEITKHSDKSNLKMRLEIITNDPESQKNFLTIFE